MHTMMDMTLKIADFVPKTAPLDFAKDTHKIARRVWITYPKITKSVNDTPYTKYQFWGNSSSLNLNEKFFWKDTIYISWKMSFAVTHVSSSQRKKETFYSEQESLSNEGFFS